MKWTAIGLVALGVAMVLAVPAEAKKKKPATNGTGSGAYCEQGGENVFIPAAEFSASVRRNLVKGRKVTVNVPGFGPIYCRVY